ncbi:MAG: hypothetical protein C0402_05825 [Thermodesulfovibrio sp.]|nr:hypothetical protein [Thermodesulfovibrio sp.]
MHFLKNNKGLVFLILLLVPAFYYDVTIITWVKEHRTFQYEDWYQPFDQLIKISTHGTTLITISLLLFLGTKKYSLRISNMAKIVFIGMIASGIAVQALKHLIGRARPRVTFEAVFVGPSMSSDYDSFPSGHTTLAFCLAYMLSRDYPRFSALFYLFAILAAMDRLIWLSHFPSDIVAGVLLGTIVGRFILERNPFRTKQPVGIPGE